MWAVGVRRIATAISTTHPISGGEPEWGPESVPPKTRETRELALGGAEERQDAQRQSGGGKQGRRQAMCKLPGTRKGLGRCRHAAQGRSEGYHKAETRTKLPSRCRERAGAPSQRAGRWFRVGGGKQEASWRLGVALAHTAAALTSSRKPEPGSLSESPDHPNSPDRSSRLQLPRIRLLSRPKRAPPRLPSAHRPSGPAIGHTRSLA